MMMMMMMMMISATIPIGCVLVIYWQQNSVCKDKRWILPHMVTIPSDKVLKLYLWITKNKSAKTFTFLSGQTQQWRHIDQLVSITCWLRRHRKVRWAERFLTCCRCHWHHTLTSPHYNNIIAMQLTLVSVFLWLSWLLENAINSDITSLQHTALLLVSLWLKDQF